METSKENEMFKKLIHKAWEDEAFKNELVANPLATIEKFVGGKLDIPAGKRIVVRDQSVEGNLYINIPAVPEADVELSEEELERVAGGCQIGDSTMTIDTLFDQPKLPPILPTFPGTEPWVTGGPSDGLTM